VKNKNKLLVPTTIFLILIIASTNISQSAKIISEIENNDPSISIIDDNENINIIKLEVTDISELKPGDILFLFADILNFESNEPGHSMLVVEYEESNNRVKCIEACARVGYFYIYSSYLSERIWIVTRVEGATEEQKQNAIDFAKTQYNRPFQYHFENRNKNFDPTDKNDPNADIWYCSELVWASYYNCNNKFPEEEPPEGYVYGEGIDIDYNGWEKDFYFKVDDTYVPSVYPGDIFLHDDVNPIIGAKVDISVSVKSSNNLPIQGATVKLLPSSNPDSEPISTKITDENGNCTFLKQETNVNIYSDYWVTVNCENFYIKTVKVPKRNYGFEVLNITIRSKSKERQVFSMFLFDLLDRLFEKNLFVLNQLK